MMRSKVVLPHPEGPSSTRNSPSLAVSVMPSTAVTGPNSFLIAFAVTEATSTSHVSEHIPGHVPGHVPGCARASGDRGGGCVDGNPDGASAAASPFDQERLAHFS